MLLGFGESCKQDLHSRLLHPRHSRQSDTVRLAGRKVSVSKQALHKRVNRASQRPAAVERRESKALCPLHNPLEDQEMGRGILLWLLGVPIPIILLLALLWR